MRWLLALVLGTSSAQAVECWSGHASWVEQGSGREPGLMTVVTVGPVMWSAESPAVALHRTSGLFGVIDRSRPPLVVKPQEPRYWLDHTSLLNVTDMAVAEDGAKLEIGLMFAPSSLGEEFVRKVCGVP